MIELRNEPRNPSGSAASAFLNYFWAVDWGLRNAENAGNRTGQAAILDGDKGGPYGSREGRIIGSLTRQLENGLTSEKSMLYRDPVYAITFNT